MGAAGPTGPRVRVNIKAQGLLNAVGWIEAQFGREVLGRIVRGCSPAVRDRYVSAIAINWHPVEEFVEFLGVAERVTGSAEGKLAERVGEAGAKANFASASVRLATYLANPEFLMRRITGLWSQFNDEGEMILLDITPRGMAAELKGVRSTYPLFCATLTGWFGEVSHVMVGGSPTIAKHTQCKARGGARCVWEVRYDPDGPPGGSSKMRIATPRA